MIRIIFLTVNITYIYVNLLGYLENQDQLRILRDVISISLTCDFLIA